MYRVSRVASPNQRRSQVACRGGTICLFGVVLLLLLAGCGRVQQAAPATSDSYLVTLGRRARATSRRVMARWP